MRYFLDNRPLLIALVLGITVAIVLIRRGFSGLKKNLLSSITWGQYFKGQGSLLILITLAGAATAGGSSYFGKRITVTKGVQLQEFRLNPADHPAFQELNVEQYSNITILARTSAPENGSAIVSVFSDQNDVSGSRYEVQRMDSVSSSWSRWDQSSPGKRLSLVISPPTDPGLTSATEVEIRAYLSPK